MRSATCFGWCVSLLVLYSTLNPCWAQIELNRFFPPVVATSGNSVIKAEGKFPNWPVQIVCDRADIAVTCMERNAEFQVNAAPSAPPGIAWIRLLDTQSASQLVPLLLTQEPVVGEVEPNDPLAKATPLNLPVTAYGRLEKNGDVDLFRFAVKAGQQIVASVTANHLLGYSMDPVLQLLDQGGNVLAQSDDDNQLDPQIVFTASQDADVMIRVLAFPETPDSTINFAGGEKYVYTLDITTDGWLDHAFPLQSNANGAPVRLFGWNLNEDLRLQPLHTGPSVSDRSGNGFDYVIAPPAKGTVWLMPDMNPLPSFVEDGLTLDQVLQGPCRIYGHIAKPQEVDRFRVQLNAGTTYVSSVQSRELGFELDSVVRVLSIDGKELARNDDSGKRLLDAAAEFKTGEATEFIIEVSDLADTGSLRHAYALTVEPQVPTLDASVDVDRIKLVPGKTEEVKVALQRVSGYSQRLKLIARGLPSGVTMDESISESKGDSATKLLAKFTAAADAGLYQGPIALELIPLESPQPSDQGIPVLYTLRPGHPTRTVWMTVTPSAKP